MSFQALATLYDIKLQYAPSEIFAKLIASTALEHIICAREATRHFELRVSSGTKSSRDHFLFT